MVHHHRNARSQYIDHCWLVLLRTTDAELDDHLHGTDDRRSGSFDDLVGRADCRYMVQTHLLILFTFYH